MDKEEKKATSPVNDSISIKAKKRKKRKLLGIDAWETKKQSILYPTKKEDLFHKWCSPVLLNFSYNTLDIHPCIDHEFHNQSTTHAHTIGKEVKVKKVKKKILKY